uniref:SPK domain-containing protein n=1 Tax=Caenorhabditis tropicalis TaxID=1561998 RepID=A0A1I7T2P3_9PELO
MRSALQMKFESFGPRGYAEYEHSELLTAEFSWIENDAIWAFLFRKIHQPNPTRIQQAGCDPFKNVLVWEEYNQETGSRRPLWKLRNHFVDTLAPNLHRAALPGEAIIKLYYGLGIKVSSEFLKYLQKSAQVSVDQTGRLLIYDCESLILKSQRRGKPELHDWEEENMWAFLCDRIHDPKTGHVLTPKQMPGPYMLWNEYRDKYDVGRTVQTLCTIFRCDLAPHIHETRFDLTTKAKLCFALRIPVPQKMIPELLNSGTLHLDMHCITFYKETMTDLVLNIDEAVRRFAFTADEDIAMCRFVYLALLDPVTRRIRRNKTIINCRELWVEFNKKNKVNRDPMSYSRRFKNYLVPSMYLAKIPKMMKMALHYALEIPVHEMWLRELKKEAIIELDDNGCIVVYRERKRLYSAEDDSDGDVIFVGEPAPKFQKNEIITIQDSEDVESGDEGIPVLSAENAPEFTEEHEDLNDIPLLSAENVRELKYFEKEDSKEAPEEADTVKNEDPIQNETPEETDVRNEDSVQNEAPEEAPEENILGNEYPIEYNETLEDKETADLLETLFDLIRDVSDGPAYPNLDMTLTETTGNLDPVIQESPDNEIDLSDIKEIINDIIEQIENVL